ncbi:hemolysin family protein [Shimia marina]|uniref:Hemolysin C n=1 Tax=Shimia marina TaxID=321267 RepID=A0A0P1EU94_9RHOB|nr:hemolysin family protein [Shimia marina]CUH54064.1 Hemolysin C [Shimia marina]SFE59522.1 magnesium and cobalt transporter [Shimia marina]
MGDSTDGSSNAALRAQLTGQNSSSNGWLGRLFGKAETETEEAPRTVAPSAPAPQAHGMVNLRRMRVEDVAVPKADIVSVAHTITKTELVQVFRESGLTRLPVYENTLDTPVGFVHLKDFALRHGFNGTGNGDFDVTRVLRPLLFVPPSMTIGVLLTKMQTERRHMALVIDEYGGVDGLVTIEDLIEQVIGDIEDEHDAEEADLFVEEKPGCYLALAKTPLEDFEAAIGRSLSHHEEVDREEIETLGGLVFMLSGHVPARGEVVESPDGVEFEVVDADPRRIKRLRVFVPSGAAVTQNG